MGSLVSLCVGTSFAKTLFPLMGAEGISAYRIGLAALVVVPIGWAQSGPGLFRLEWLWPGLVVAALSSALPYALEMYALGHLPKRSFSILLSLEPAVGALAGWAMLSEALSVQQGLAVAFIMAASMGSAWSIRGRPDRGTGNPAPG